MTSVTGANVGGEDGDEDGEGREGGEPEMQAGLHEGIDEEEAGVGEPHPGPLLAAGVTRVVDDGAHRTVLRC